MNPSVPELSVVVAVTHAGETPHACLTQLLRQAEGRPVQIIVVEASTGGAVRDVSESPARITRLQASPQCLVPQLWSLGIEHASAPIVALTIGQCVPDAHWIDAVLHAAATHAECAGFGGPIDGPEHGRWRDWAVYFSRYSAFLPPLESGPAVELAGDNAAYRKSALQACGSLAAGFWETLVHHRLRALGWTLWLAGDMRVRLGPCPSAWLFCRERYRHGRYFGSTRPGSSLAVRVARIATAPALAPFLIARIGARVARRRRDWLFRYVLALPWLAVFVACWSAGEVAGYLVPQRRQP